MPLGDPPRPLSEDVFAQIRDRRRAPRRRLRDRIASLERTQNEALRAQPALQNHLLLVDDELRQTALALGRLEAFLTRSMTLLESAGLTAEELAAHAADEAVLDDVEELAEDLARLRQRMGSIATAMK